MANEPDTLLLFSQDAEEATLGSIFLDPGSLSQIKSFIKPHDFYVAYNQIVFQALCELDENEIPIDFVTVLDMIKELGGWPENSHVQCESHLIDLLNSVPTSVNIEHYALIVKKYSQRRQMVKTANYIVKNAYDIESDVNGILAESERMLRDVQGMSVNDDNSIVNAVRRCLDQYQMQKDSGGFSGIPTGFAPLDEWTNGLRRKQVSVWCGRPGMGKSILSMQIAIHAAEKGYCVVYFSPEMSEDQLMNRVAAYMAQVDHELLERGKLTPADEEKFYRALGRLSSLPLVLDCVSTSPMEMRSVAIRADAKRRVDMVVVDHMHEMASDSKDSKEDTRTKFTNIIGALKFIAKRDLDAHVLVVAQLNRAVESRENKRPTSFDLAESGKIEQVADLVMGLYNPSCYEAESTAPTEVIILKNRNGRKNTLFLHHIKNQMRFGLAAMGYDV